MILTLGNKRIPTCIIVYIIVKLVQNNKHSKVTQNQ